MNEQVKEIINRATINSKIGIPLFDKNGELCCAEIKNRLFLREDTEDEIEDSLIIRDAEDEDISFDYDENELIMYVPQELKDKILFSIEYVLSEFDKINDGINDLNRQFNINRIAAIRNAEDILKIQGSNYSNKMSLCMCRNSLGDVLFQLQMNITDVIDYIYNIPTDKRRIFKIKVKNVLAKEKEAQISLMEYIKGVGIYAEISMKLGDNESAVRRVDDALEFIGKIEDNKRARIEGWNQKKDMFWIRKLIEYEIMLKDIKSRIENKKVLRIEIS